MPVFRHLERLTASLARALTVDDTARIVLTELLEVQDVVRVGIALAQGAGRELRFVSSDGDALSAHGVRWCTIDGLADVPLARTARSCDPIFISDQHELDRKFPEFARRQRLLGTHALATLPLIVDEECLGGLLICWSAPQEHNHAQRGFLAAFAAQVAHAVRRGLAYQAQRTTSEELQRSLMPHSLPDVERLDFGAHYQPAGPGVDVGGDWYDVLALPDGGVVVSLGDVMGKGVEAAVVMGEIRAAARAYALLDPDPSRVLERLHHLVSATATSEQLITMVLGVVDPSRTQLRLAVAGHPPPLVVRSDQTAYLVEEPLGPALGLAPGPWPTETVRLDGGDSVLLYSDGLVESRDRDLSVGIELLVEQVTDLQGRQRTPRELCARVAGALVSDQTYDDVTVLAIGACAPRRSASRSLPADTSAPGLARQFLVEQLRSWSIEEEVVERAELCVSELVTNAVMHTATEPTVNVSNDGESVLLTVRDRGRRQSIKPAESAEPDAISGRGLSLVGALARSWNVEHTTGGTSVWCELPLEPDPLEVDAALGGWGDLAS